MTSRPKQIGTSAESAVLRFLQLYFPQARREVLHGSVDHGDITGCGDFIFEVKAGKQTAQVGDAQLLAWMREARVEAENEGVTHGVLVLQRAGVGAPNAHRWWAFLDFADFAQLVGGYHFTEHIAPVRLELGEFVQMLADRGHIADQEPATPVAV